MKKGCFGHIPNALDPMRPHRPRDDSARGRDGDCGTIKEGERGDVEGDDAGAGDEEVALTRLRACPPSRRERNSADCNTS